MGDPKKYYYNTYEVGVGVSNNKATFNSYQSFSFGNLSYEKTMKGTRSQNVDVSGLKGEYYIGARIRGYNSYTGGMLKGYSTQAHKLFGQHRTAAGSYEDGAKRGI